jgi:hypothetical protein
MIYAPSKNQELSTAEAQSALRKEKDLSGTHEEGLELRNGS